MEDSGNGRGGSFRGGAQTGIRRPEFHTVQQGSGTTAFTPMSVLDKSHIVRGANGMSTADRARQPLTGQGLSVNGQSSQTFDDHMWIGNKSRTFG